MAELVRRSGCGLLLDVNNVHVSARNHGFDVGDYLAAMPGDAVGEYHLAGHAEVEVDGVPLLIDDHASRVAPEVWDLFERALAAFGPRPTLVEWDNAIPPLAVLLEERAAAQGRLERAAGPLAHAA